MQKCIFALPTDSNAQRARQAELQAELSRLVADLSQRPGLGSNGVSGHLASPSNESSWVVTRSPADICLSFQLVFAHCDLLSGNVILPVKPSSAGQGTEGSSQEIAVSFMDYEYATPSPAAFDIANHFAEWGGFDCDWSVLPTRAQRRDFITQYIGSYFQHLRRKPDGKAALPAPFDEAVEVDKLMAEVDTFRGLPGFYWGVWALIQAEISEHDFDYAQYAETRLAEHQAWRDEESGRRAREGRAISLREKRWAQEE